MRGFKKVGLRAFAFLLLLWTLPIIGYAQSNDLVACAAGQHPSTWKLCLGPDVPGQSQISCQQINVCLPNCPEGYTQLSGSADSLIGKESCVPAKGAHSQCAPLGFKLARHGAQWNWYLRAEISEACALLQLSVPLQPVTLGVTQDLQGEAVGQFIVAVGENGRPVDSSLLSFYFTALPKRKDPLSFLPTPSQIAAIAVGHLRFQEYVFRGRPIEFESPITIHFKLRDEEHSQ